MTTNNSRIIGKRSLKLIVIIASITMIIYALFFQKISVYSSDGEAVSRELKGGDLVKESVLQNILLDEELALIVDAETENADCPT